MRSGFLNGPAVSFVFAGMALLTSCSQSRHAGDERYYLVATNIKFPYWQAAADGLNKAASEMKVTAELVGPDKYD